MAKVAKPYEEGSGWSLRRRVFGQDLFESGHASGAAAKKAMDMRFGAASKELLDSAPATKRNGSPRGAVLLGTIVWPVAACPPAPQPPRIARFADSAMNTANTTTTTRPVAREVCSAIRPIRGGPAIMPR